MRRALSGSFVAFALVVATAGCGSGGGSGPSALGGGGDTEKFCRLQANMAANALKNMDEALGNPGTQDEIVGDLLKEAPATQSDLKAAAPAEPRKYYEALEKASTQGDAGADTMVKNVKALNTWSLKNCPAKYQPVLKRYAAMGP